jgi:hypothetical protein
MSDVKIECPHCHKFFKLNETLAAPLVEETRRKFQREFEEKEEEFEERRIAFDVEQKATEKSRKAIEREREALAKQQEHMDEQVAERVEEQRAAIAKEEAKKAKLKFDEKLAERDEEKAELEEQIKEKETKLAEARKQEAEFRRKERELDDKLKAADIEVEKRLTEALGPEREKAKRAADDEYHLKLEEEREKNRVLLQQLEEAKRRAEQGSQQLQGEVQELDLEKRLQEFFRRDTFEEVAKGQRGADILHRIMGDAGQHCGAILWESKNTLNWEPKWLDKLKQDQRLVKADLAVIVTKAMPQGIDSFREMDGVWVTTPALAVPLGAALRVGVVESFMARRASEGQQDKMAILYQYLTGPQFRQRVEAIRDAFTVMQADLGAERTAFERMWAKRQKQIDRVMVSTVGMYGDLEGIAGKSMPEIEGLELKMLGNDSAVP